MISRHYPPALGEGLSTDLLSMSAMPMGLNLAPPNMHARPFQPQCPGFGSPPSMSCRVCVLYLVCPAAAWSLSVPPAFCCRCLVLYERFLAVIGQLRQGHWCATPMATDLLGRQKPVHLWYTGRHDFATSSAPYAAMVSPASEFFLSVRWPFVRPLRRWLEWAMNAHCLLL